MKFFLLAFLAVSVSAQQQCCNSQPQPVVIQLSCNNDNNGYQHPQPMHPAPAPAPEHHYEEAQEEHHYYETPAEEHHYYEEGTPAEEHHYYEETPVEEDRYTLPMDPDRQFCEYEPIPSPASTTEWIVKGNGPLHNELPDPFHLSVDHTGMLHAMVDTVHYQLPPHDWDGRDSTLGFPIPPKGSRHYNMLLCWPYPGTINVQVDEVGMAAGR